MSSNNVEISIVVPVYNAYSYLHKCIESITNQTMNDWEAIFVDDGSTDGSLDMLLEYERKDKRIKVLRQNHQYAGVARNKGLEIAQGKYILFLDADDFFDEKLLRQTYVAAESNNADIVIFGFDLYDNVLKKQKNITQGVFPRNVFCMKELEEDFFEKCYAAPWNKLFLKTFVRENEIWFQNSRKCNDVYFTFISLALAKRIVYIEDVLVHYRINNNQSLQGNTKLDRESFMQCAIDVKKGFENRNIYDEWLKKALAKYCIRLYEEGMNGIQCMQEHEAYYNVVKETFLGALKDEMKFIDHYGMTNICSSSDYKDYLYRQTRKQELLIQELKEDITEKREFIKWHKKDYRVGNTILKLPRTLKSGLRRLRH